jgi:hypothetical protein
MRNRDVRARSTTAFAALALCLLFPFGAAAADWQNSLTKEPPGHFPPLRPLRAKYNFGWSGITAAAVDIHSSVTGDNRNVIEGSGRTIGFARALWRYDVNYRSIADADALRPIESKQIDTFRGKKITTNLSFNNNGVSRARIDTSAGGAATKPKRFDFPDLHDLQSVLLYVRSQPLKDRSTYRVVVYPATNAYVATVTVTGREKISVRAGSYNAIKLDLQLNRVGKNLELEPHKKFRRATIWVSDDTDRILLRIEAQVFVGTVFAELQSVQFER